MSSIHYKKWLILICIQACTLSLNYLHHNIVYIPAFKPQQINYIINVQFVLNVCLQDIDTSNSTVLPHQSSQIEVMTYVCIYACMYT